MLNSGSASEGVVFGKEVICTHDYWEKEVSQKRICA